jgi:hypothetical protein
MNDYNLSTLIFTVEVKHYLCNGYHPCGQFPLNTRNHCCGLLQLYIRYHHYGLLQLFIGYRCCSLL